MNWILLSIVSAILLGFYDAAKKWSVRSNAVPVVLLASVTIGAIIYSPLVVWSRVSPDSIPFDSFVVDSLSWRRHGLIFGKSVLVGASWTFAFSALKHLPLSIAAPIRATSPFWTIAIAILFFGERPAPVQWIGIVIVLGGFWMFTIVGRREGIRFLRDRWVALMVLATLLGACSSIYDKWLLQYAHFDPVTMQAWFTIYLVPVMVPLALWWFRHDRPGGKTEKRSGRGTRDRLSRSASRRRLPKPSAPDSVSGTGEPAGQPFIWRWSIAAVSPLLLAADWFYFVALSDPTAMVSVVSVIRRCSVVIALGFGVRALSEQNFRAKFACVALILVGVVLLTWHG